MRGYSEAGAGGAGRRRGRNDHTLTGILGYIRRKRDVTRGGCGAGAVFSRLLFQDENMIQSATALDSAGWAAEAGPGAIFSGFFRDLNGKRGDSGPKKIR